MNKNFEEYLNSQYPKQLKKYKEDYEISLIEDYFQSNIRYSYLNKPNQIYRIIYASYTKDNIHYYLESIKDKSKIGISKHEVLHYNDMEAHKVLRRIPEDINKIGNIIPNDKRFIYINNFTIQQIYTKCYNSNKRWVKVTVWDNNTSKDFNGRRPYYELYCVIGDNKFNLKHVYSHDGIGRENYNTFMDISIRDFKSKVFGNPNIKLKCDTFLHIPVYRGDK